MTALELLDSKIAAILATRNMCRKQLEELQQRINALNDELIDAHEERENLLQEN